MAVKQKIELSGEKEYSAALASAKRNLRTLKTEIKAETAELGKNATEQQKNEARAKSLTKQIAEQEKIVSTYRAELDEVRKKYGDNADAVAKYEQQLNNARAVLGDMKSELDGIGQSMNVTGTDAAKAAIATKSFADSLESIGSVGESVSGAIEDIFKGMVENAAAMVGKLWGMIDETAQKADNWSDYGSMYGTDAQTIQKYSRAVAAANDSWSDLQATVGRIVLGKKNKEITELLGISGENYLNDFDYAMAVMDRLNEMSRKGTDMDSIYTAIFGSPQRSEGVMDLVNDWQTIRRYLDVFDGNATGFGMTDEQLAQMQQVALMSAQIEQKWIAIQDAVAAAFAPRVLEIQTLASGALDGLAEYLNAATPEEQDAALEKIRENVEQICLKIGDAIREGMEVLGSVGDSLKRSEDPVTRAIGEILSSVADTLEWFINNQEAVKGAFEAIFGVWLLAKLAAVAGKLSSIVANIEAIRTFSLIGSAGVGASAAAEAGTAAGTSWGAAFGAAVLKAVPWLAGLITLITPEDTASNDWDTMVDETTGELTSAGKEAQEMERRRSSTGGFALETDDLAAREAAGRAALTPEQAKAAEDFWDIYRSFKGDEADKQDVRDTMDTVEAAFAGQEDLMRQIVTWISTYGDDRDDSWMGIEDLPANFWQQLGGQNQGKDQLTGQDVRGMTNAVNGLGAAVEAGAARGVSGIKVTLDGETVGRLVAPYVSAGIARNAAMPW